MAPPPPPPPMCLPFGRSRKPLPSSELYPAESEKSYRSSADSRHSYELRRSGSYSPTATLTSAAAEALTYHTSEYNDPTFNDVSAIPALRNEPRSMLNRSDSKKLKMQEMTNIQRSNTVSSQSKAPATKQKERWGGYGFGLGAKNKEKEQEKVMLERNGTVSTQTPLPVYQPPSQGPSRQNSKSSKASKDTYMSSSSGGTRFSASRTNGSRRPGMHSNDSSSTLVGSALDRKINDVESVKERVDTTMRLEEIRKLMQRDKLDYYIIPSEDAHGSEYVASCDKRREYISGFTGSAGQAIISKTAAYLITDSRYWLQARNQLDENWFLIPAGAVEAPKDWIEWIVDRAKDAKIGIDARMITHEKATMLNSQLAPKGSKLAYPSQNLVDLIWLDKPPKPKKSIFIHSTDFAGKEASAKLQDLRDWIEAQPANVQGFSKSAEPKPAQRNVGTLLTSLSCIAYLLNLRGDDIPFNPVFHAYLYVSLTGAVLFIDKTKVDENVDNYLAGLGVSLREYSDIWPFLRKREYGDGRVLLSSQTPYAISLMLTHFRYTIAPSIVEEWKAVKNEVEIDGLRRAYLRDGAAFVRFLAWLEHKFSQGFEISEWEAAFKLTEFRRKNKYYKGLAYENISASGPNAALPHYTPFQATARIIDRETPYLMDSGGQYRDGTCDTTRTLHYGRPTPEMCDAYTRVLQGHIAIDSAVFPEGTSGAQLDVLARKQLWKDGLNYGHGTGHGFGSFLNVHEGPHSFSSNVPLVPGHVITNEPGYYQEGQWGMRIESALAVRRVKTRGGFNGDIWLGFERLTCVPIQTKMVNEKMLSKEEKLWLKDHNNYCRQMLEPYLRDDKIALKWLKREAERGIGISAPGPGGFSIEWD